VRVGVDGGHGLLVSVGSVVGPGTEDA